MKYIVLPLIVSGREHCELGWTNTEMMAYGDGCVPQRWAERRSLLPLHGECYRFRHLRRGEGR
jgi:hypothetical protein